MRRLWFLCAPAGFLLASATPPAPAVEVATLQPEPVLDVYPFCMEGRDCTQLAGGLPALPEAPMEMAAAEPKPEPARPALPAASEAPDDGAPKRDSSDGLRILVSIPQQKAYVFDGDELLVTSPVSTGKRGHETPVGTFRILQKKVFHRSNRYANAPMPYMQRLTSYGIALHAGHLPGYPASHGCIRLPRSVAKKLYDLTDMGTRVTITRQRPKSPEEALTLA